ncbi:MAG: pantoate--beta-alanine ligase [Candidatus Zixiibacteriota bacterium]|nr:MAG: pantoate--beta-alanine ligase [candidate division Zixibacteria bacterium]
MIVVRSIKKMQALSRKLASEGKKIGLVPTMGFLHEGHLSLIKRAAKHSDAVITTIFVNPTQFGPNEDLNKYPRDEKGDLRKIKQAGGDIVFIPKATDIYPGDFQTYVAVEGITKTLEGAHRPTHFRGVTTIVAKLFNTTRPDVAVFGLKDYQQAMVLKQMARDLDYPIKIIVAPTVREKDGLAMSSRNKYFNPEQRKQAVCLYKALQRARTLVKNHRMTKTTVLSRAMGQIIRTICRTAEIDYIAFTDFESLRPVKKVKKNCICSLAIRLFGVRLIDNMKMM